MAEARPYLPTFEILVVATLCLAALSSWSQDNAVGPATQGPDRAYGDCAAPTQSGVNVCSPKKFQFATFLNSPFQVIASATGGRGEVRVVQVWADGSKIGEVGGNVFNQAVRLPVGSHELTLVELDSTGFYVKSSPISLDIEGDGLSPCDPPNSPGVNVCVPYQGGCHDYPFSTIVAAGRGADGPVVRMELWVGNTKIANSPGNRIDTNLYLHEYSYGTIIEVDSKGGYIKSQPFWIEPC